MEFLISSQDGPELLLLITHPLSAGPSCSILSARAFELFPVASIEDLQPMNLQIQFRFFTSPAYPGHRTLRPTGPPRSPNNPLCPRSTACPAAMEHRKDLGTDLSSGMLGLASMF